jgi:hypothetical protein
MKSKAAVNLTSLDFAESVTFLAFGMLLLVRIVSLNAASDEAAANKQGRLAAR